MILDLPNLIVKKTIKLPKYSIVTNYLSSEAIIIKNLYTKTFQSINLKTNEINDFVTSKNAITTSSIILNERYLVQTDNAGFISIWDLTLGILKNKIKAHKGSITSLTKLDEFKYLTTGYDGYFKEWHIIKDIPIKESQIDESINEFHLFPDSKEEGYYIRNDSKIFSRNIRTDKEIKFSKYELQFKERDIENLKFNVDLDYTLPINNIAHVGEKNFAFTVGNNSISQSLIFASWNDAKPYELTKIVDNDGFLIHDFINIESQQIITVLLKDILGQSKIKFYNYSGSLINEYGSGTEISSILYDDFNNVIMFKEVGRNDLLALNFYGKKLISSLKTTKTPTLIKTFKDLNIVVFNDGVTSFYDDVSSDYFFSIYNINSKNDWLILDKDGRFDGSEIANSILKVRTNNQSFSLNCYFDKFYTPNLMKKTLFKEALTPIKVIDYNKTPPSLSLLENAPLESLNKDISLSFYVKSLDSKLKELKVYQNGKVVFKTDLNLKKDTTITTKLTLNSAYGSKNYFYSIATDDNGQTSEKCTHIVDFKGASDGKPNLYIFSIGINNYINSKYNLNYSVNDAKAILEKLTLENTSIYGNIFTKLIINEKATKSNIIRELEDFKKNIKENDVVIFYYAGHGVSYENPKNKNEYFFILHDVTQMYGDYNLVNQKGISSDYLTTFFQSINSQKQIFLIDACHSGGALASLNTRGVKEEEILAKLARSTGSFWITASGINQTAAEIESDKHGAFTYVLLNGLNLSDLTIRGLMTYIEKELPLYTKQKNGKPQYPVSYGFGNDFPIKK